MGQREVEGEEEIGKLERKKERMGSERSDG